MTGIPPAQLPSSLRKLVLVLLLLLAVPIGVSAAKYWLGDRSVDWQTADRSRAWPGPNSNTFVTAVLAAVPELRATLPPTAIGKDFPYDARWIALTPSRTGIRLSLDGYLGITAGWVEGFELNFLGAVFGLDLR